MRVHTYLADSAAAAVARIQAELGPEAIVLDVRQRPAPGLARWWQKPRIEVLACSTGAPEQAPDTLLALREEVAALRQRFEQREPGGSRPPSPTRSGAEHGAEDSSETWPGATARSVGDTRRAGTKAESDRGLEPAPAPPSSRAGGRGWRIGSTLESLGLLPLHAQRVVERLAAIHGPSPPASLGEEVECARGVLFEVWQARRPPPPSSSLHVLVGPAGTGKTTCLCKWLTQAVLLGGQSARVWRLDGLTANTAECLSVHAEILGVPLERSWQARGFEAAADIAFIDLPGVDWRHAPALAELGRLLQTWPSAQVHLALNAAYETRLLLEQARAFDPLPVTDLILTHLDEGVSGGKLWNLVWGTNYTLSRLSGGQNIPGQFAPATAERMVSALFPAR